MLKHGLIFCENPKDAPRWYSPSPLINTIIKPIVPNKSFKTQQKPHNQKPILTVEQF